MLAAGIGSRFGGGKLLAPYKGGRLIDGALCAASRAPVESLTIVTGHNHTEVSTYVGAFFANLTAAPALKIVHAEDHADGLAASLLTGIKALSKAATGMFVFLGDMPDIPANVSGRLARSIGDHAAAAPACRGVRGHPVLFKRSLFPALSILSGDQGARYLLDGLGSELCLLECENPGVLFDVDRQKDLALSAGADTAPPETRQ